MEPRKKGTATSSTPRTPRQTRETKHTPESESKPPVKRLTAAVAVAVVAILSRCGINAPGIGFGLLPGGQGGTGQPVVESGATAGSVAEEVVAVAEEVTETVTEEETSLEETETDPLVILEVTVNDNGYLYKNQKASLAEIFADAKEGDEIHYNVRRGRKDDIDALVLMAKEKGVKLVEVE